MSKKLFAFDIDGTLFNDDFKILPETLEALKEAKQKGHILVLASGRGRSDMQEALDQSPKGMFSYMVCNNGAYVVNSETEEITIPRELDKDLVLEMEAIGRKFKAFFAVHTTKGVRRLALWEDGDHPDWFEEVMHMEWYRFHLSKDVKELEDFAKEAPLMQLSLRGTKEVIEKAQKEFHLGNRADLHIANDVYLDINPLNTSKMTGLQKLGEMIGFPVKDMIVFGDSGNDIQMLQGAGKSYAMGNGTEQAKAAAHHVIGDNNKPSIANAVKENI